MSDALSDRKARVEEALVEKRRRELGLDFDKEAILRGEAMVKPENKVVPEVSRG